MLTFSDQIKRLDRQKEGVPMLQALLASAPAAESSEACSDETFLRACRAVAYAHGIRCMYNEAGESMMTDI